MAANQVFSPDLISTPPVIVIGMHRSGTTLLARMMSLCGVFWGWERDEYHESRVFQELNERLFTFMGAAWDHPEPAVRFLSDARQYRKAEASISECLTEEVVCRFFGIYRQIKAAQVQIPACAWGWKDPRNTITLPVWRTIFPQSRVIHLLRNGVDVSASLWKRETSRKEGLHHPHYSRRSQTLEGCFMLWKHYVETGRRFIAENGNALTVRFEDILENPLDTLHRLSTFIHPEMTCDYRRAATIVDPTRRLAYRNDPSLTAFYHQVADDPTMRELGYA